MKIFSFVLCFLLIVIGCSSEDEPISYQFRIVNDTSIDFDDLKLSFYDVVESIENLKSGETSSCVRQWDMSQNMLVFITVDSVSYLTLVQFDDLEPFEQYDMILKDLILPDSISSYIESSVIECL